MTALDQEDPAAPEVTEDEAWYDAEIAPALLSLAQRCNERGMAFVAVVEYQPGDRAGTYMVGDDAGLAMHMVNMCSKTAPNVDAYIINLSRFCKSKGIDIGASLVMKQLAP